jgi:hypothetical protein
MSRTPASITQPDVARAIRAAKQAGAATVELRLPRGGSIYIHLDGKKPAPDNDDGGDVVL